MRIFDIIISLLLLGITGMVCLFLWVLTKYKDELWEIIEKKEEEDDTRN